MISTQELQQVNRALWAWRRVRDVMIPWGAALEIGPEAPALAAIDQMVREGQGRLGVVQDGRLVGLVTRRGILRRLSLRGVGEERGRA
jgi:predicted transcriptional regulator